MLYCDSRCSQTLTGLSLALPGAVLCYATRRLGDRQRVILRQRIRGSDGAVRAVRNTRLFETETRVVDDVGDEIPSKAFNYGVNCHQINIRLNSPLLITVTATSGGLLSPLEGCLRLLGAMIIVLHSFLAQYFEPSIVYISSFPVEIIFWQS